MCVCVPKFWGPMLNWVLTQIESLEIHGVFSLSLPAFSHCIYLQEMKKKRSLTLFRFFFCFFYRLLLSSPLVDCQMSGGVDNGLKQISLVIDESYFVLGTSSQKLQSIAEMSEERGKFLLYFKLEVLIWNESIPDLVKKC